MTHDWQPTTAESEPHRSSAPDGKTVLAFKCSKCQQYMCFMEGDYDTPDEAVGDDVMERNVRCKALQ